VEGYEAGAAVGVAAHEVMYSGLHDYQAAVKAYQADLGDQPTGVLTVWRRINRPMNVAYR
jgi:hypothetical protein